MSEAKEPSGQILEDEVLTTWEKVLKRVYSKQEWKAYLLNKLKKRLEAKAANAAVKDSELQRLMRAAFGTTGELTVFMEEETENYIREHEKREEGRNDVAKQE